MTHEINTEIYGEEKVLTKANVIVSLFIIALVIAAFTVFFTNILNGAQGSSGKTAIVHDSDGNEHVLPLDEDGQFRIETDSGVNVVAIQDGEAYMLEADCDGQDCVHQGAISSPGEQIICLPHKLWIEVVDSADSSAGSGQMDINAVNDGTTDGDSIDSDAGQGSSQDSSDGTDKKIDIISR